MGFFGGGEKCPKCGEENAYYRADDNEYYCPDCGKYFGSFNLFGGKRKKKSAHSSIDWIATVEKIAEYGSFFLDFDNKKKK